MYMEKKNIEVNYKKLRMFSRRAHSFIILNMEEIERKKFI